MDTRCPRHQISAAKPGLSTVLHLNVVQIHWYDIQSAFSIRLSEYGFDVYPMLVVDLLHEFELGIWKAVFTHLLRILYTQGHDTIQTLNRRQVIVKWYHNHMQILYQISRCPNIQLQYHQMVRKQCFGHEKTGRSRLRRPASGEAVSGTFVLRIGHSYLIHQLAVHYPGLRRPFA